MRGNPPLGARYEHGRVIRRVHHDRTIRTTVSNGEGSLLDFFLFTSFEVGNRGALATPGSDLRVPPRNQLDQSRRTYLPVPLRTVRPDRPHCDTAIWRHNRTAI